MTHFTTKEEALSFLAEWQSEHIKEGSTKKIRFENATSRIDITCVHAYSAEDIGRGWTTQPILDVANKMRERQLELAKPKPRTSHDDYRERMHVAMDWDSTYKGWLMKRTILGSHVTRLLSFSVFEASMTLYVVHTEMGALHLSWARGSSQDRWESLYQKLYEGAGKTFRFTLLSSETSHKNWILDANEAGTDKQSL